MIKRVTLGLIALGVSTAAIAGHPGDDVTLPAASAGINLTAPHQAGSWSFGAELLYWQVANNDFNYANTLTTKVVSTATPVQRVHDVRTHTVEADDEFGFRVDGTYHFAGNGRDVTLSYTRLHSNESESVNPAAHGVGGAVFDTFSNFAPLLGQTGGKGLFTTSLGSGWDSAKGTSRDDYDAVDLSFGQEIHVGRRVYLHPFAGVRWADIDNRDKATYGLSTATTSGSLDETLVGRVTSDFRGIGPRFGTDAQVNIGGGFSVRGRVGVSLLVGNADSRVNTVVQSFDSSGVLDTEITENLKTSSQTRVVPEADARIGINYGMHFNGGTGANIELGYEVNNYFDVIDNSIVSYVDTASRDNDFGLHGFYLRAQIDLA